MGHAEKSMPLIKKPSKTKANFEAEGSLGKTFSFEGVSGWPILVFTTLDSLCHLDPLLHNLSVCCSFKVLVDFLPEEVSGIGVSGINYST